MNAYRKTNTRSVQMISSFGQLYNGHWTPCCRSLWSLSVCVCGVSVWSCQCVLSASPYLSMWHTSKVEKIEKQCAGLLLPVSALARLSVCKHRIVMIHRHWFANNNQFGKFVTVRTSARAKSIIRAQNAWNLIRLMFHCIRNLVSELRSAYLMPVLLFSAQRSHWNSNQFFRRDNWMRIWFGLLSRCRHNVTTQFRDFFEYIRTASKVTEGHEEFLGRA